MCRAGKCGSKKKSRYKRNLETRSRNTFTNPLGEGLCVEISRQAIADKIGSKRETVSRELSGLARSGHLRIGGRKIFLLKPKELRELIK